jgi:diguanylate cyclase (GGDEF)-like protein
MAGACVLAAVLISVLFVALPYILLTPLAKVGQALEAMTRREADHRLRLNCCDEFGRLSWFFNDMAKALRDAESQAEHLAFHDARTDLPNRRMLINPLYLAIAASNRYGRRGALLHIDLDGLKRINDSMGHAVVDDVLAEAAGRLLLAVSQVDTVARIGGDEFVVLVQELPAASPMDQERVQPVAEKILDAFSSPMGAGITKHQLGVSIGVRIFDQEDLSAEAIVQDADEAMYLAKRAGGQQLWFFAFDEIKATRWRHAIRKSLTQALLAGTIQAHFQPQIDACGSIHGAETLLRWSLPDWGLLPPREVVLAAEELGLSDKP